MKLNRSLLFKIKTLAAEYADDLRQIRRELHQHPELSGRESWTAGFLAEKLDLLGLNVQTNMGGHGLVADLVVHPAKPTTALRLDMDALPIHEINQVPYRSQTPGVMHACGHDIHSAVGVGTAAVLTELAEFLSGNVRFIFQPEEEEITGALRMIRAGALSNPAPDAIFGLHVAPIPVGQIAWTDDLFLAGFDHYLATIEPHGGEKMPPEHLDAIALRCCQVIQGFNQWELPKDWESMQSFWQAMHSGSQDLQHFIIYDASTSEDDSSTWHGQFGLGIKAADQHLRRAAAGRVKATLNTVTRAAQTRYHLEPMGSMPDMRNHSGLVHTALSALIKAVEPHNLIELKAAFPFNCEDFAFYTKHIPGAMFWLGAANPAENKFAMLHTPDFDVDERCLEVGTAAMAAVLLSSLEKKHRFGI